MTRTWGPKTSIRTCKLVLEDKDLPRGLQHCLILSTCFNINCNKLSPSVQQVVIKARIIQTVKQRILTLRNMKATHFSSSLRPTTSTTNMRLERISSTYSSVRVSPWQHNTAPLSHSESIEIPCKLVHHSQRDRVGLSDWIYFWLQDREVWMVYVGDMGLQQELSFRKQIPRQLHKH